LARTDGAQQVDESPDAETADRHRPEQAFHPKPHRSRRASAPPHTRERRRAA